MDNLGAEGYKNSKIFHKGKHDGNVKNKDQKYIKLNESIKDVVKNYMQNGLLKPEYSRKLEDFINNVKGIQSLSYSSFRKHYDAFLKVYDSLKQERSLTKEKLLSELTHLYLLVKYDENRGQGGLSKVNGLLSNFLKEIIDWIDYNKDDSVSVRSLLERVKTIYEVFIILIRIHTRS